MAIATVFTVVIILWLPRLYGPLDLRWDGAVYHVLGTSLAQGKGYSLLNEPGEISETQYPPLLPAVIATLQLIFQTNDPLKVGQWLRFLWFFFFGLYAFLVYCVAKTRLTRYEALIASWICQISLYVCFLSDRLNPELLFVVASLLFYLATQKTGSGATFLSFLSGASAFLLRTIGIALLAGWIAEAFLQKRFRLFVIRLFLSALPVVPWLIYVQNVERSPEYRNPSYRYQRAEYLFYNISYSKHMFSLKDPFTPELGSGKLGDFANRLYTNLKQVPASLAELVSGANTSWYNSWKAFRTKFWIPIPWPFAYALLILPGWCFVSGVIFQLVKRRWLFPLYVVVSIVGICLTPAPEQRTRYLMPLLPFLVVFLLEMIRELSAVTPWISQNLQRISLSFFAVLLMLCILGAGLLQVRHLYKRNLNRVDYEALDGSRQTFRWFYYDNVSRALNDGLEWLKTDVQPNEILASSQPQYAYLKTGRRCVMPPFISDPSEAQRLLDSVPVNYLVLDRTDFTTPRKYSSAVIQAFPDYWEKIYSSFGDEITIYRRIGLRPR